MAILFYCKNDPDQLFENQLRNSLPELELRVWPETGNTEEISYAVTWGAPAEFYRGLENLQAVFSLAAGVDHLIDSNTVPEQIPIVRLLDAGMGEKMAEYVLFGALYAHRKFQYYRDCQLANEWAHESLSSHAEDFSIGILGLGTLGTKVAHRLLLNGYSVHGWTRTERVVSDIKTWHGTEGLASMAAHCDVLVCLLPLTDGTRGILNQSLFDQCKEHCFLINAARGAHLNDSDLIKALDAGRLSGALLDVTSSEPLCSDHAFWKHSKILLTPHIAAPTQHADSIGQIVSNIKRHQRGEPMRGVVNRAEGY